uniref:Uncharacterized protein n=1 Tax=Schistosoma curassoni TaxID=6186 RepID=A0A183KJH3_9TREM
MKNGKHIDLRLKSLYSFDRNYETPKLYNHTGQLNCNHNKPSTNCFHSENNDDDDSI